MQANKEVFHSFLPNPAFYLWPKNRVPGTNSPIQTTTSERTLKKMRLQYYNILITLISSSPWGEIVPRDGVISNSFGDGIMVLPVSLMLLSIKLSRLRVSSFIQPSAGTRTLNVMGMSEVLTSVHSRVFTKPTRKGWQEHQKKILISSWSCFLII